MITPVNSGPKITLSYPNAVTSLMEDGELSLADLAGLLSDSPTLTQWRLQELIDEASQPTDEEMEALALALDCEVEALVDLSEIAIGAFTVGDVSYDAQTVKLSDHQRDSLSILRLYRNEDGSVTTGTGGWLIAEVVLPGKSYVVQAQTEENPEQSAAMSIVPIRADVDIRLWSVGS